jgi:hypothetical protein
LYNQTKMRLAIVLGALLIAPAAARADLDVCRSERAEAEQAPAAAEDVRAFQRCMERWRNILGSANAELSKAPPEKRPGCEEPFAEWQAAATADPSNYDAMMNRLHARERVDGCNSESLLARPSPEAAAKAAASQRRLDAEHAHRSARGMVILGSILVGVGGAGLTVSGALGLVTLNAPKSNSTEGNAFQMLGVGVGGLLAGVMSATGAVILGFGAHQYKQTQTSSAF